MVESGTSLEAKGVAHPLPQACWSCRGPVASGAAFCATCRALQPPAEIDHFRRFDLSPAFDLQRAEVERRYFALQRQFHPDRFAGKSATERLHSVQHATALNQAFGVLADPLLRAEYLLQLSGRPVAGGEAETVADPELLLEAMALREELAEAEDASAVAALLAKTEAMIGEIEVALSGAFASGDLAAAAGLALRFRYMRKFVEEATRRRRQIGA